MKNTEFRLEDVIVDLKSKGSTSPEQINELENFFSETMWL